MLNNFGLFVYKGVSLPHWKREYLVSAEELIKEAELFKLLKKDTGKKLLKFLEIKVVGVKKVCIFAVRLNGSAGVANDKVW